MVVLGCQMWSHQCTPVSQRQLVMHMHVHKICPFMHTCQYHFIRVTLLILVSLANRAETDCDFGEWRMVIGEWCAPFWFTRNCQICYFILNGHVYVNVYVYVIVICCYFLNSDMHVHVTIVWLMVARIEGKSWLIRWCLWAGKWNFIRFLIVAARDDKHIWYGCLLQHVVLVPDHYSKNTFPQWGQWRWFWYPHTHFMWMWMWMLMCECV